MRWDRGQRLRAVAIQSDEGQSLLAAIPAERRLDSWHLVGPDGSVRSAGGAAPPLLRLLPGGALPAALLAALPALTERAYRWVAGNRDHLGRFLSLALVLTLVGCGSTVQAGSELTVHASLPLEGEQAGAGRDALAGAELALEQAGGEAGGAPVNIAASSDVAGAGPRAGWTQARVAANARDAAEDSTAIAYLGELDSDATRVSTSITNEAGIPQISPGPVGEDLLRVPGGNDPPGDVQTTGERTLIALRSASDTPAEPDQSFIDEFEGATGREASTAAAYGFEAMALTLAAIDAADDPLSRESVLSELLATNDRESILGIYSIDSAGAAGFG